MNQKVWNFGNLFLHITAFKWDISQEFWWNLSLKVQLHFFFDFRPVWSRRIYLSHKIFVIDLFNTKYFANQILIANTKMRWSHSIYNTRTFSKFFTYHFLSLCFSGFVRLFIIWFVIRNFTEIKLFNRKILPRNLSSKTT